MASGDYDFNALNGAIFVQPAGPGTEMKFLGCHESDDVEASGGERELNQVRTPDGRWEVTGERVGGPEQPTTTITGFTRAARDWLEKVRCPTAALYIMQSKCGRPDNPMNYSRAKILHHIHIQNRTYSGLSTNKNPDTPDASEHALEIVSWPPLVEAVEVTPGRVVVVEVNGLNDLWTDPLGQCGSDCGAAVDPGDVAGIACDSAAGPATGNVLFSTDGAAFAAGAADPFGAGLHVMAIAAFPINKAGRRWLVGEAFPAGGQGHIAYSDNDGTTWTVVNIGGAAAGHGPAYGGAIYAPVKEFVILASAAGYIYKSADGGVTWTAKESAVITAGNYMAVHFANEKYGCAVAAAGVVALTANGGESWYAGGVIGGGAAVLNCVRVLDNKRILVGDAAGKLWQSVDFGETWTEITGWTGARTGQVRSIDAALDGAGHVLWMAHNSAAPLGSVLRSIDGGANWVVVDNMPANSGINAVRAVDANTAYAVGEANGGTGFLAKITEA